MRFFVSVYIIFVVNATLQAQSTWKTVVYWGDINIQYFAKEVPSQRTPPKPNDEKNKILTEEINIIGDTLAMYVYRNVKGGSTAGTMFWNRRFNDLIFLDSLILRTKPYDIRSISINKSQPKYYSSKQVSILFNDKIIYGKLNMDSVLEMPVGTKLTYGEIVQRGGEKMILFKYAMQYQDEVILQIADLKTGVRSNEYKFSHIDPFPKLINYYNLNQKNIFEVINNRDSIQLTINDSAFGDFKPGRLTTNGSGVQLTMQKYSNGDNVRISFKNKQAQFINIKPEENNILLLFQRFNDTDTLKLLYQFIDEEKSDTTWHTASDVFILQFTNLLPGKRYSLKTKYNLTPYAISYYVFTVDINWWQTTRTKFLIAFFAGAFLIGFGWMIYRNRQQRWLKKVKSEKEQLNLQLDSVRSQLNPHFIFNALASVQSLINKNDVHNANVYLSQISTLMRETLEYSKQAMISLEDEIKMITNYVNIEQLRSPFTYIITIDPDIQQSQIDVPAMLLQPIVENSIKHALSSMPDGKLSIKIFTAQKDMHIQIEDNGKGFDVKNLSKKGYGLRLTEERIGLFNKLYQHCSINFNYTSEINKGTQSTFILNNWINT
ncbi:MAG: histidine kinase [Chitinophagaceae bacterium]|nr:histidine kinase [Chitinophagaceae bacterium]